MKIVCRMICLCILVAAGATQAGAAVFRSGSFDGGIAVAGTMGQATYQKGFPGYGSSPVFGADVYFTPHSRRLRLDPGIWDRVSYRINFQYLSCVMPDTAFGTTENIMTLGADAIFSVPVDDPVLPYAGLGLGAYTDTVRVKGRAVGDRSSTLWYAGARAFVGLEFKITSSLSILPEAQAHWMYVSNSYFTMHTVVRVSAALRW